MIILQENAYITISEADLFFQEYLNGSFWDEIPPVDKEKYIITASKEIDMAYHYIGYKTDEDQTMQFPRTLYAVVDIRNDSIFQDLKDAVCFQIEHLYKTNGETDEIDHLRGKGVSSFDIGGVSGDINLNHENLKLSQKAYQCLKPYIMKNPSVLRYSQTYLDSMRNRFFSDKNIVRQS